MSDLAPIRKIPGNEYVLKKLQDLVASGEAIAFVGAGASAGKYPLWTPLLNELADLTVERGNATPGDRAYWRPESASDPLGIAGRIKGALGPGTFYSQLEDVFRPPKGECAFTETHTKLVSLPFKGFVTTNYDRGLVDAWQVAHSGAGNKRFATHLDDPAINLWLTGDIYKQDSKPILHAHGVIDDPRSLILTLQDYKDAYKEGTLYRRLFERLIIQDKLVFVGFGFADPWMFFLSQSVLGEIRGKEPTTAPRHIALIGLPNDQEYTPEQRRKFEEEYDAQIVFYPVGVSTASEKRMEDHSALAILLDSLNADPEIEWLPAAVPFGDNLSKTMSNPRYADDFATLGVRYETTSVINRETVFVVVGTWVPAELLDRPVAESLRDQIDQRGQGNQFRRVIVLTDTAWYAEPETFKNNPTIAVGGPPANLLSSELHVRATKPRDAEDFVEERTVEGEESITGAFTPNRSVPQIALWGRTAGATKKAVEQYLSEEGLLGFRLERFLDIVWK